MQKLEKFKEPAENITHSVEFTCFHDGFGQFPYFIVRDYIGVYYQLPIIFKREGEDLPVEISDPGNVLIIKDTPEKDVQNLLNEPTDFLSNEKFEKIKLIYEIIKNTFGKDIQACLVLGRSKAYYIDKGNISFSDEIPYGGMLLTLSDDVIAINMPHFIDYSFNKELHEKKKTIRLAFIRMKQVPNGNIWPVKQEKFVDVLPEKLSKNYVSIKEFCYPDTHILLDIMHSEMNTILDFTGAQDYQIFYLDDNHKVLGGTYARKNKAGFMIQTQYKKILLLRNIKVLREITFVESAEFEDYPHSELEATKLTGEQMMEQVYARPYEKVRILESDPDRFYIVPDVWLPRCSERINILHFLRNQIRSTRNEPDMKLSKLISQVALMLDEKYCNDKRFHSPKWLRRFKEDDKNTYRYFKLLENAHPNDDIFKRVLFEIVDIENFVKIEENGIPFFIGSKLGIMPRIQDIPEFLNERRLIAILRKSVLSDYVAGLFLYEVNKTEKGYDLTKIAFYPNY